VSLNIQLIERKRTLRRAIFGHNMEEITRGWRKLHDEEIHNFCSSENTVKLINWRIGLKFISKK
jgi:hypothetical protein